MKLVRKMRKIPSRQNHGAKQDEAGVDKEEDEKDKKEILKEEKKTEVTNDQASETSKADMRRYPPHGKEKSVHRVTLRIHHLKDKSRGKPDHFDFNGGVMEGVKVVEESPPVKETPSEEATEKEVTPSEAAQPPEQSVSEVQTAAVKRSHSTDDDEEGKKKKRKEETRGKPGSNSGSPKSGVAESEDEEVKNVESPGPKVPPLKIVISGGALEEPGSGGRNGKAGSGRHHLPYVVATSTESEASPPPTGETEKEKVGGEDAGATQAGPSSSGSLRGAQQRSRYNRRGKKPTEAGSRSSKDGSGANNGGSVDSSPAAAETESPGIGSPAPTGNIEGSSETDARSPTGSGSGTSTSVVTLDSTVREAGTPPAQSTPSPAPPLELHPRKRKIRPKDPTTSSTGNTVTTTVTSTSVTSEGIATTEGSSASHETVSNSYQLFLNIRKQIERKRKGLFPVQPKPPQGFKDYLMNRCTYLLANNTNNRVLPPLTNPPASLPQGIKDLFISQEKDRHQLLMQHLIEKEKLVLSVEQEILRVHGRAARALANQSLPFSACTILKDEEVYSAITPEQEEKDRNARSRYNGRLFLSWLQDVDDKWEKIKEAMLLRHHNEAESLHAVQKMDWEWKMKEIGMCESKAKPIIEDTHVPIVHVSDDFDLLQAL